jgi:DNA/RNA-binding domain of Phe-tRNA-synthetase-like protein
MIEQGWVAPAVASEFPGLGLASVAVDGPSGRSPASVRHHLNTLSDRFMGGHAVHMRERPIPSAYRVFFRQIGLDPDRTRTPVEALALERMKSGAFKSRNQLDDALTIATIETGVALRAFDAARIEGELGIRDAAPGEELEGRPGSLPQGTLVISDQRRPLAILFGATAEGRGVQPGTERIVLAAIQVNGVPQIAIEEALWMATTAMTAEE